MEKRVVDMGINLFKIFPNTKYYFYYNEANQLVSHVYIQDPNDSLEHPVLKEPMNGMYYVWAVETINQFRSQGYAQQMLEQVIEKNKSYFLRVDNNNVTAIHIYTKLGFKYYKNSGESDQIMILYQ